jgi:hypothetical protein
MKKHATWFAACLLALLPIFLIGKVAFGIDPDPSETFLVWFAAYVFGIIDRAFFPATPTRQGE